MIGLAGEAVAPGEAAGEPGLQADHATAPGGAAAWFEAGGAGTPESNNIPSKRKLAYPRPCYEVRIFAHSL